MSELVTRLRNEVIERDKLAAFVSNMRKPRSDNTEGRCAQTLEDAADKIERLVACGADAIAALRLCLSNPLLTHGQRAAAQEALDKLFDEQEFWEG